MNRPSWHSHAGSIGRVNLIRVAGKRRKPGLANVKIYELMAKRKQLGLPVERVSPVTGWRRSKYMKKGTRKPKHPRVRLRETVAKEAREIQDFARRHATAAVECLAEIIGNSSSPENARIAAAVGLLDRAYGKPNQSNTNLNIDANAKPNEASSSELDRRIEEALRAVENLTGRTGKTPKSKKQPADLRERDRDTNSTKPQLH